MVKGDSNDIKDDVHSNGYNKLHPFISDNNLKATLTSKSVRIDPYKNKEKYLKWKQKTDSQIPHISPQNAHVLRKYLTDMENGFNVASSTKKGARSFVRLNTLRIRMVFLMKYLEHECKVQNILEVTETQICSLFADMTEEKYITIRWLVFASKN